MAEEKKSRTQSAMGGKKKSPSKSKSKSKKNSKRVHEIHLRRAHSGELLAKHKHAADEGEMPEPDEDHVVPQGGLDQHVAENMPPMQPASSPVAAAPAGPGIPGM